MSVDFQITFGMIVSSNGSSFLPYAHESSSRVMRAFFESWDLKESATFTRSFTSYEVLLWSVWGWCWMTLQMMLHASNWTLHSSLFPNSTSALAISFDGLSRGVRSSFERYFTSDEIPEVIEDLNFVSHPSEFL